ncbi:hypothetical protein [Actinophytocola sp.]|uniref:hypothetical protein n=1 Tax=Actinophytocola sp. TaxID=1872138 RepID=UPI003D6A2E9A
MLALFSAGLVLGGMLSALVLWLASGLPSPVPQPVRHALVVALAGLGVLRDAGVVRFPLPQNARQVPRDVLNRDVVRGSLRFGFELGTGVRTYVPATSPYVLAAALLLSTPDLATAALTGAGFGLGRALTPLTRYAGRAGESWDVALRSRLPAVTVGGALALAAGLAVLLFRPPAS